MSDGRRTVDGRDPGRVRRGASTCTAGNGYSRGLALRRELQRKLLHLPSVAAPVAYAAGMPRHMLLAVLSALLLCAVVVELARHHLAVVRRSFNRATWLLLRPHERAGWSGATWLLVAFTGVVALAPAAAAIAAMWSVSVGDAAAALVGRSYSAWRARGAPDVPGAPGASDAPDARDTERSRGGWGAGDHAGKTLAGSVACMVVSAFGAVWLAGLGPRVSLLAGVAAAVAERPRGPFDDNVRVATAVAVVVAVAASVAGAGW